jgi:PAS domain S-box-containing protein
MAVFAAKATSVATLQVSHISTAELVPDSIAALLGETSRIEALRATGLLDAPADPAFDRLTGLAARVLGVPIALVTLVDSERQYFLSCRGMPEPAASERQTPLKYSLCQYVVASEEELVVGDTRGHPLVGGNLAVRDLGLMAYAGIPLTTAAGHVLGSFCAIDTKPRSWSEADLELLRDLAASAVTEVELHMARRAVRVRDDELVALLDHSSEMIWSTDVAGRITYVNRAFTEALGYTLAEAGQLRPLDLVPDESHGWLTDMSRRLAETGARVEFDGALVARDGNILTCRGLVTPHRDGGVLVGARDVTAERAAEAALRQSEERLRQAQKMDAIGQLAGGVAHDFNNMLTAIACSAQLALEELTDDHAVRNDLVDIREATDRAAALTRQLLAFSRRQLIQPAALDLNSTVRGMERMLQRVLGGSIEVRDSLDERLWPVHADAGQMEQVLLNLAVNARDAMHGHGALVLATANVTTSSVIAHRHGVVSPGEYVVLSVRDTGAGMSTELLDRIFEPFFTTKPTGEGTGLGLSTVHGIVHQMKGQVTVQSSPGRGTTFSVYLPRHVASGTPTVVRPPHKPVSPSATTILVVDDEPAIRAAAARILVRQGFRVVTAEHGADALQRIEEERTGGADGVNLVLTDVMMPVMNGRDLGIALAARHPDMPVVYMSGYTADELARQEFETTGRTLVTKPFSLDRLVAVVRGALARGGHAEEPSRRHA